MDPDIKKFINTIACPICGSLGDGLGHTHFYCSQDSWHYSFGLRNKDALGFLVELEYEITTLQDDNHRYSIHKFYDKDNKPSYKLKIFNIDLEGRIVDGHDIKEIETDLELFDFRKFDAKKAIKKIKTYLTFH